MMMKNAHLYNMRIRHAASVNQYTGGISTAASEQAAENTAQLTSIAAVLEVYLREKTSQTNEEKDFLDTPALFNLVVVPKEEKMAGERDPTFISVVFGQTTFPIPNSNPAATIKLEKLRNTRIVDDKYGAFSSSALYQEDQHLRPAIAAQSTQIEKINIDKLSAADAARIFIGISTLLDAQQFVKTQINAQVQDFLAANLQIDSIVKFKKMYQLNHPQDKTNDIYLELIQSAKLINQYQKISAEDKPEGLPVFTLDNELQVVDRFLPNGKYTAGDVTNAEDAAAFKLITQARELRATLQLQGAVEDEALLQTVKAYKKPVLELI
jgi:hypothetical protein